ncbi:MAG: globin [Nitriliruptorales bacterium]|nr:globin [Nitriliruptorales bacterium]
MADDLNVYEAVGGLDAFVDLVNRFYERVEADDVLRPIYPDDLEPGKRHLAMFLAQYFGGGPIFSSERGHPRLRKRHAPFAITVEAADRWAGHMAAAIREQGHPPEVETAMLDYVTWATPQMINQFPTPPLLPTQADEPT